MSTLNIRAIPFAVGRRLLSPGIELSIPRGALCALRGPNGSGKSLLLDAVTGVHRSPVEITVDGRSLGPGTAYSRWRSGIRRLFQNPVLPPELRVEEILDTLAEVPGELGEPVWNHNDMPEGAVFGALSFGQRRLVELRVALSSGRYILLDEPFAGLHSEMAEVAREWIRHAARSNRGLLVVDHSSDVDGSLYDEVTEWPGIYGHPAQPRDRENFELLGGNQTLWPACPTILWRIERFDIDGREVMSDTDIELRQGEVLLLAGGNGSGKSTLLRALGGFNQPWSGVVSSLKRAPGEVSILLSPQPPKVVQEITGIENLKIMLAAGREPDRQLLDTALALAEWLGLRRGQLREHAEVLSGGEASILALVGALLSENRPLVLLDEPFEALSPSALGRALDLVGRVARTGKSIIMSSHDPRIRKHVKPNALLLLSDFGIHGGAFESRALGRPLPP